MRRKRHKRFLRKTVGGLALALLAGGLLAAAGCAMVAYPFVMFQDHSIPAVYEIPNRRTLILVDDPNNQFSDPVVINQIAENMAFHLRESKALTDIVANERLIALEHDQGAQFAQMSVHNVGQTLGAEQVIHVKIRNYVPTTDPGLQVPAATAWVRVWDVAEHQRLFPTSIEHASAQGYPVTIKMKPSQKSTSDRLAHLTLERQFAGYFAEEAAGMFYKRKDPGPGHLQDEVK